MTEEDLKRYEEHKRKRNEIVFKKFEGFEIWKECVQKEYKRIWRERKKANE
jgi:hypothetical protein